MRWSAICTTFVLLSGMGAAYAAAPLDGWVDLQGHRGARGLSPENTIPSFRECLKHGMTTIELDTTLTQDNQLIVHHDTWTNPTLCQSQTGQPIETRRIRELTRAELSELDCGSKTNPRFEHQRLAPGVQLITLPEFFAFVRDYEAAKPGPKPALFNIEIKVDDSFTEADLKTAANAMVTAIREAGVVARATVQSFRLEVLPMVSALEPLLVTSALFEPSKWHGLLMTMGFDADREDILAETQKLGAGVVSPYHLYVTPEFIEQAHAQKIKVIPWTVNDEERMRELIEMGVDGLISDYPDRLLRASSL